MASPWSPSPPPATTPVPASPTGPSPASAPARSPSPGRPPATATPSSRTSSAAAWTTKSPPALPEQFAFSPPSGHRNLATTADEGEGHRDGGQATETAHHQ